ncbi:NTP transferase domain-containing protein [Pararoseomonas indoligenes]|uniref:Molybdopterin-binding/glycosyltransferase family 2 protein n=1 Tax=Roseomonas indoligenes TaxID=2820811 RepID=A0A940MY19_9PROT|nr:molybdopterin-binding/glycosyltransferase family 2 protein [Pararoseomonas indoligenes]MBP0492924.1 molybdopterin-binding/glycosyltransferase family 2 protein [Pararoseomonas indoligenes]
MIFGPTPLAEARGAVLAHTLRLPNRVLKKGTVLDAEGVEALRAGGHAEVVAARLESGDVPEDEAADRMANAMLRPLVARTRAATGRVNLLAETAGLLRVDAALVDRLNALDESLTLATLPDFTVVQPKDMLATVKVIPFAVPGGALHVAEAMLRGAAALSLHPFRPLKVGLVSSELPGMKDAVIENGIEATRTRIEALAGTMLPPERCAHETAAIAEALGRLRKAGAEMLLVMGASAVVDRRDVAPAAIIRAGGTIEHFGMPVDPGNLLCLGRIGETPAMVLPGCARSPKVNGFDWVLERIFAGVPVSPKALMRMGVGGLLKEIETRPLPRGEAPRTAPVAAPRRPRRVAALVLAAGRSRRMAPLNKLMVSDREGRPMVARVVENALASRARPVLVVTGHEHERVEEALSGRPVLMTHAEDYAEGLSASLKAGIAALPPDVEGVLVMLGDMPLVSAAVLDRLLAAFDPEEGRAIIQPTFRGKQGNPVLWGREFFEAILGISGDVGARHLTGLHADRLFNVEMSDDGVLRDFDTADTLKGL